MNQVVAQLTSAAVIGRGLPLATMATIAVLTGWRRPVPNAVALPIGWSVVLVALKRLALGDTGATLDDDTKAVPACRDRPSLSDSTPRLPPP